MRLGLLSDIHEAVELLAAAVRELRSQKVEAFVMLGDVLDTGERAEEVVGILSNLPGAGVWGNHDLGLCGDVEPALRARFAATVLDYFAGLQPRLDLAGCRFQHIDPHLDPGNFLDLWRFPTVEERVAGFRQCPDARVFMGHLHRWCAFTHDGQVPWEGERPLDYRSGQSCLTIVHAVRNGWCAMLDTERDVLQPVHIT